MRLNLKHMTDTRKVPAARVTLKFLFSLELLSVLAFGFWHVIRSNDRFLKRSMFLRVLLSPHFAGTMLAERYADLSRNVPDRSAK